MILMIFLYIKQKILNQIASLNQIIDEKSIGFLILGLSMHLMKLKITDLIILISD